MSSALQKLSKDLIVYSVLLADFERLDFKNDALAGVRANYFNSHGAPQSDNTEIEPDGRRLRFRYEMKTGKPLLWKISGGNQPYQTVTRGSGGSYCVLCYTDNGTVCKRAYFDSAHVWQRTEYYSADRDNALSAVVSPYRTGGLFALKLEKHADDGSRTVAYLYPSQTHRNLSCAALLYSNAGMLWYDVRFAPTGSASKQTGSAAGGFDFRPGDFTGVAAEPLDFAGALPLSDADVEGVSEPIRETLPEEEKPYSAYDKIERILFEAQKTNKNIFGEVVSQAGEAETAESVGKAAEETIEEPAKEATEAPAEEPTKKSAEEASKELAEETAEKPDEAHNEETVEEPAAESETEPEKEPEKPEPEYEITQEPESDMELKTPNGVYSYYGATDENGQRTGRGRTTSPDGTTVYDGEYRMDKRNGFGICYYKDGSPNYVGDWLEGSRSGRGVGFRRSDGTVHAGKWTDNTPNGVGARFDSDGAFLDVCSYKNGVRSGKSLSFDEVGNVVIRVWEDGELISERVITDEE